MKNIAEITASDTYEIRNIVLRPGLSRDTCVFGGDDLITTKHFGYFDNDVLTGIISLYANSSDEFPEENQLQLRGMAVLENYRDKKHGLALLEAAERYATEHHFAIIWFNARENATGFYERSGYRKKGDAFEIEGVGKHYIMYKIFES